MHIKVYNSDGDVSSFDKSRIVNQLINDTTYYNVPIPGDIAEDIANEVEKSVEHLPFCLTGSMIRSVANAIMQTRAEDDSRYIDWIESCAQLSIPRVDCDKIDLGGDDEEKENANLVTGPEKAAKHKQDRVASQQMLYMLPRNLRKLHLDKFLHVHDAEYFSTRPFCDSYDMRKVFRYGFVGDGSGRSTSVAGPAKHLHTAVQHIMKTIGTGQSHCAGGQGTSNVTVYLAPYARGLSYTEITQAMQELLYEANQQTSSRGSQAVFSSVELQMGIPSNFKNAPVVSHGKVSETEVYGDYEKECRLLFKAFMEVSLNGDLIGKPFGFPKPEVIIRKEFLENLDTKIDGAPTYRELLNLTCQLAAKFGSPYFANDTTSYSNPNAVQCRACCAYLWSDNGGDLEDKINFKDGKFFNSMGDCTVVTINFPRLAYIACGDDAKLYATLEERMRDCVEIIKIKVDRVNKLAERGRLPFLTALSPDGIPLTDITNLSNVIGYVGLNELVQYHTGYELHDELEDGSKPGWSFGIKVMNRMRHILQKLQVEYPELNLTMGRTPAETVAQKFAVCDLFSPRYGKCTAEVVRGDIEEARRLYNDGKRDLPIYYTNGNMPRYDAPIRLDEKIQLEQVFFPLTQGGNIMHIFLGEKDPDPEGLMSLVLSICNTEVGYFDFTRDFTICFDCQSVSGGINDVCPTCGGSNVDQISRITGYLQSVSGWNEAKKEELRRRYRYG